MPKGLTGCGVHRAGWVMADKETILENGFVRVAQGRIVDVGAWGRGKDIACPWEPTVDHGPGALMAAPVNAHTHLELSALAGRTPWTDGFQQWVATLLREREAMGPDRLAAGAAEGVRHLIASGCGAVGEVSTLGLSRKALAASGLFGVWFQERLGRMTEPPRDPMDPMPSESANGRLAFSLAGHAPHTTAPDLIKALKAETERTGSLFSIHLAESEAEDEFIRTGAGAWAAFLTERSIRFDDWPLPSESPVRYADKLGLLDSRTLAVHLLRADRADLSLLARRGARVCVCPRSNMNLHGRLPDIAGMLAAGIAPALGTDSLASCPTLDIFDEMAFISRHYPDIDPAVVIQMATENGAAVLGLAQRLGILAPGGQAAMIYAPVSASRRGDVAEAVVNLKSGRNGSNIKHIDKHIDVREKPAS